MSQNVPQKNLKKLEKNWTIFSIFCQFLLKNAPKDSNKVQKTSKNTKKAKNF